MTDKNGTPVVLGCWVRSKLVGEDVERAIWVTEITGSGQDMEVEVIPASDPEVQTVMTNGFEGQGGRFGGGGASGSW